MFRDGQRRLVPIGSPNNRTGDDGEYRLAGLAAGTYYVKAETRETWTVVRDGARQVMGYAPTFFPGTTQAGDARRVTVQVGQSVGNVDFSIIPGRAARISGIALDSHGRPFQDVVVQQEVRGEDFGSFGQVARGHVNPDGTFTIDSVPPGEYVLATSAGRDTPEPQVALTDITVDGVDIDNVVLTGSAGGTVAGRVITDEGAVPDLPRLRVTIMERMSGQPSPFVVGAFSQSGLVDADGSFTVKGVFGRSWLSLSLPDAWMVKSVTRDGRDIIGSPFLMSSGKTMTDVQIVVTNKVTTLSGRLVDGKGAPIAEATVVVFASDADRWQQGARAVRATRPDQQGEWRIRSLPPGEYLAVAVDYVEDGRWNDPEYLESLRRNGEKLTLTEGSAQAVALRVVKPEA